MAEDDSLEPTHVAVNDDDTRRQLFQARRNLDIGSALDDSELNSSELEPNASQINAKQLELIKMRKTKVLAHLARLEKPVDMGQW